MESFPALLHWYTIGLVPYRGVLVYVNLVISWNRQESKRSQDADATGYFHFHIQLAICTSIAWSKGVRGVGVGGGGLNYHGVGSPTNLGACIKEVQMWKYFENFVINFDFKFWRIIRIHF